MVVTLRRLGLAPRASTPGVVLDGIRIAQRVDLIEVGLTTVFDAELHPRDLDGFASPATWQCRPDPSDLRVVLKEGALSSFADDDLSVDWAVVRVVEWHLRFEWNASPETIRIDSFGIDLADETDWTMALSVEWDREGSDRAGFEGPELFEL